LTGAARSVCAVHLDRLWLTNFRNYACADLRPAPAGLTVITGGNGQGKTNLLEAIAYLARLESFRGAPPDALVRTETDAAVIRAEIARANRRVLVGAELPRSGRATVQINRQALRRWRDLLGVLQVTPFLADDLQLVKGGPQPRRRYLDGLLVAVHPRHDALCREVDRILRQRTALLQQAGPGRSPQPADVLGTLDVWDAKLAASGEALAAARQELVARLSPHAGAAYEQVAQHLAGVRLVYRRSWEGDLAEALAAARPEDLRRGLCTVGPHRDDLVITLAGMPARTHASQGEQRALALSLRLAGHEVVTEAVGERPVLLLDDVFSELDAGRAEALVRSLPTGQALVTTAAGLPAGSRPDLLIRVEDGRLVP
jgi:DNA replication and repair protein RecF